jgi:hypothetical protein
VAETVLNLIWIVLGVAIAAIAPRYTITGVAGSGGFYGAMYDGSWIAGLMLCLRPMAAGFEMAP